MGILKDKFGQACVERFNQGIYQAIFVHTGSQYMTDTLKKPQIFQKGLTVELKTDGNAGAFRKGLYVGGGQPIRQAWPLAADSPRSRNGRCWHRKNT